MSRLGRGHPIKSQYQRGVIGLHVADSATVGLLFTPEGVDEYTVGPAGEYFDSGTITLNLDPRNVTEYPFPTNRTVIDDFNRSDRALTDTASGGLEWANVDIGGGSALLEIISNQLAVGFGDDTRGSYIVEQFGPDVEFYVDVVTAPISPSGIIMFARAQNVGVGGMNGYALQYSALGSSWALYVYIGGAGTLLTSSSTVVAAGDKIGFRVKGTTLTGHHWRDGIWTEVTSSTSVTNYPDGGHFGIQMDHNVARLDNLSGGVVLPVEVREHNDAATVTLTLAPLTYAPGAGAGFPTTSLLDDFERADGIIGSLADGWNSGIYTGEVLQIIDGELVNVSSWGSAYRETVYGSDQEVWFEFADDPFGTLGGSQTAAGIELAVRLSSPGAAPNGYFFHFQSNFVALWKMSSGSQGQIGTSASWPTIAAGDKIGVEAVGSLLRAYFKAGSDPWYMLTELDVSVLDGTPYLGGGYIGMLLNGAFFENMGGGEIAAAQLPVDTYHGVDASTLSLALTPSGVDEYTGVAGIEYIDSATVPLAFTVSATEIRDRTDAATVSLTFTVTAIEGKEYTDAATVALAFSAINVFPYGQPLLDNFNRADAVNDLGPNWEPIIPADGRWDISNGEIYSSVVQHVNDAWITEFEARNLFVWTEIAQLGSGSDQGQIFLIHETNTATADCYGLSFESEAVILFRLDNNATTIALASDTSADVNVGDCMGLSLQGTTLIAYQKPVGGNWIEILRADISALIYEVTQVGIASQPSTTTWKFTNFGGGSIPSVVELDSLHSVESATIGLLLTPSGVDVHTPGVFEYVDSATVPLTFTVSATELEEVVDAQTVTVTLTASAVETREIADTATVAITLTPSTIETQEAVDATTVTIGITGTSLEVKEAEDAATAVLGLVPSAVVLSAAVDSAVATVLLTPSAVDELSAGGVTTDAATIPLALTASSVETYTTADTATIPLAFTFTFLENYHRTDSATVPLLLTPSAIDDYVTGGVTLDSATVPLAFTVSATELATLQDAATPVVVFTASAVETRERTTTGTLLLQLSPSAVEEYEIGGVDYVDADTAQVRLTASTSELAQYVETGQAYLHLQASAVEEEIATEVGLVSLQLTPSHTEFVVWVDAQTVPLTFSPTSTSTSQFVDSATALITFTPEFLPESVLIDTGTIYLRFTITEIGALQASFTSTAVLRWDSWHDSFTRWPSYIKTARWKMNGNYQRWMHKEVQGRYGHKQR